MYHNTKQVQHPSTFTRFTLWATNWGTQVQELMGATGATQYNEYSLTNGGKVWNGVLRGVNGAVKATIEFTRDDRFPGRAREYRLIRLG